MCIRGAGSGFICAYVCGVIISVSKGLNVMCTLDHVQVSHQDKVQDWKRKLCDLYTVFILGTLCVPVLVHNFQSGQALGQWFAVASLAGALNTYGVVEGLWKGNSTLCG